MIGGLVFSPKIKASDWCHKGVVTVYVCLLWVGPTNHRPTLWRKIGGKEMLSPIEIGLIRDVSCSWMFVHSEYAENRNLCKQKQKPQVSLWKGKRKSGSVTQHFGLPLCSLWWQMKLLCNIWKGTCIALIWGIKAWCTTRGCRVADQNVESHC